MSEVIYTIDEIKNIVLKILKKYGIKKAYIFGSYARNEAKKDSDIDIMIVGGTGLNTLLDMIVFESELKSALNKNIDVISEEVYSEEDNDEDGELARQIFMNNILKERIKIYE